MKNIIKTIAASTLMIIISSLTKAQEDVSSRVQNPTMTKAYTNYSLYKPNNFRYNLPIVNGTPCNPTGTSELFTEGSINVFPNPNGGLFSINSTTKICSVEIINILGEKIYADLVAASSKNINLSNEPSGIYMVRLKNDARGIVTKKISVIHER